jgi:hypothetical protein
VATEDRKHRRTAKTVRNITRAHVHLRLRNDQNDKPYRIELKPRGVPGDWDTVPAALTSSPDFIKGEGTMFEVIPAAEAKAIEYEQPWSEDRSVTLVRDEETVVSRSQNPDKAIQENPRGANTRNVARVSGAAPRRGTAPGSEGYESPGGGGSSALPDGALEQRVTTERVKQQD